MSIRLLELFGGIGSCTQAFKRLNIPHEVVDYVEIDKYAVKSYNAMNGTNFEPQDISKWDKDIEVDFIMHGSPCQDFSVAGQGKGASEGGETRSSLMYETVRIVSKLKPQYVLWENVKNVLSKKHKHNFDNYLAKMEELGYHNYYQVLNAKDYGVPQNRERIFVLSFLDDIDYQFPEKQELNIRLKDILEDEVDEKYYISSDKVEKLVKQIVEKQGDKGLGALLNNCRLYKDNAPSLRSQRQGQKVVEIEQLAQMYGTEKEPNPQTGRIYSAEGISPCMDSCQGGNRMPKIVECEKVGYFPYPNSDKCHQSNTVYSPNGLCPTIDTMAGGNREPKILEVQQIGNIGNTGHGGENVYSVETISPCLKARDYKGPIKVLQILPILTPDRLEKRQNGRRCKEDGEPMFTLTGQDRHGVVLMYNPYNDRIIDKTAPCVTTMVDRLNASSTVLIFENIGYLISIRKLTPKECWRLMGFSDEVFHLAEQVNSNSQLYKQAGNSIVVDVLVGIIEQIHIVKSRWLDEILGI